jgi:arginase
MAHNADIQIITAASILGLKPNGVEKLPETLLSTGLHEMLKTRNAVIEIPTLNQFYSDQRDGYTYIRNVDRLKEFSLRLHKPIKESVLANKFALILGGDCSILIGIMSALKSMGTYGLFFIDAHADFYEPEKSITGEAADMDLALVTGRGPEILTDIGQSGPYVKDDNVVHIGQRDLEETKRYGSQDIGSTDIQCFDFQFISKFGLEETIDRIEKYANEIKTDGFWIHFDADVLADDSNPAVDYRLPGGLSFEQCETLLKSLIKKHNVVGMSVTIFNPNLDTDGSIAEQLTACISKALN